MATQKNEQDPTNQQNQGCRSNYLVFLFAVFLFLSVIFLIRFIDSVSSGLSTKDDQIAFYVNLLGLVISFITLIVTIAAWLFPGKILPEKLKKILSSPPGSTVKPKTPQKARYFVSYHESDYRLARKEVIEPLKKEGRKRDFSIIYSSWSKQTKYNQEMARADKKAEFTLTILTPRYLDELKHDHAWMQEFEGRNQPPGKDVAILITECERGPDLESIEIIDLTTENTSADRAGKLLTWIPETLESDHPPISGTLPFGPPSSHNAEYRNIPYPHDRLFTGREQILKDIYDIFDRDERAGSMRLQAITGLSGMGKTKTAVEYAYRYASRYRAILWIDVSIYNDLYSVCKRISFLLEKPENAIADKQEAAVEAAESTSVKTALEPSDVSLKSDSIKKLLKKYERWLLVLDKCEDLDLARKIEQEIIFPGGKGHILLTTRWQGTSSDVHPVIIKIKGLEPKEGALFLLRRSEKIGIDASLNDASSKDQEEAEEISKTFVGFPLGLVHAGAYIKSGESLSGYHRLYQTQLTKLLRELPGLDFFEAEPGVSKEGFKTIATTWSITIRKLKDEKPIGSIAAELLRFCAFLSNDAVPEEIIKNAPDLGRILKDVADQNVFDAACEELAKYSLLDRSDRTLRVHPVLQAVIREGMIYGNSKGMDIRRLAERAIKAVNKVLPDIEFANWQRCQQNLSCALTCIDHIDKQCREQILSCASTCIKYIEKWDLKSLSLEDMRLLYVMGHYHLMYGNYAEAVPLLEQSLRIHEKVSDEKKYPCLAKRYYTLAEVYRMQGKFVQADEYLQKVLGIANLSEIDRVVILNNLGRLYEDWEDWGEQAGAEHYSRAEKYYEEARRMREDMSGKDHMAVDMAVNKNDLAGIYLKQTKNGDAQEKFDKAKTNYFQAWETFKEILGPGHPLTVQCRANLAALCIAVGHISGDEKVCIMLYQDKKYIIDPERDYQDTLKVSKEFLGDNHPQVAARLANLAELYRMQDRPGDSGKHYSEAVDIIKKKALKHPRHAYVMLGYADLLEQMHRDGSKESQVASLRRDAREILNTHKTDSAKPSERQNEPEDRAGKNKSLPIIQGG